jgi:hypothetical protein
MSNFAENSSAFVKNLLAWQKTSLLCKTNVIFDGAASVNLSQIVIGSMRTHATWVS